MEGGEEAEGGGGEGGVEKSEGKYRSTKEKVYQKNTKKIQK